MRTQAVLWECVWECWLLYCVHLIEVTFHCKRAWGKEFSRCSFASEMPKYHWSKTITVRSKKILVGWIFKQLLCLTTLGTPRIKCKICYHGPISRLTFSWCVRHFYEISDRPRLTGSLLQKKLNGTDIWMLVCHSPWVWGPFLWSQPQGKLRLKNDLQASVYKQFEILSTQNAGKAIFLPGGKTSSQSVLFRPLLGRNA